MKDDLHGLETPDSFRRTVTSKAGRENPLVEFRPRSERVLDILPQGQLSFADISSVFQLSLGKAGDSYLNVNSENRWLGIECALAS